MRLRADAPEVAEGLRTVREEHEVPGRFPDDVVAEAERAAERGPAGEHEDLRSLPLLTIDPEGSMDLDQALHLERLGDGHRVRYAIADVAAWVTPGGAIDAEARRRVVSRYLPDGVVPLHPPSLSEDAASLLPGADRPAVLWTIDLDATGAPLAVDVRRALVRSRRRLTYEEAQAGLGDDPVLILLREVGERRIEQARARGALELPLPDQEVRRRDDGELRIELRESTAAERYNAQLSLLTGICAADLMAERRVGLLRTLPPPDEDAPRRLREVGEALGLPWHGGAAEALRVVDPGSPEAAAFAEAARALFRGSGYALVPAEGPLPQHTAIGAAYAHVTAPLRRLGDRFASECCLPGPPPGWATEALPELPATMAAGRRSAGAAERAAVDLVEALVLAGQVGQVFDAIVLDEDEVLCTAPVVRARCDGGPPVGRRVSVRLAAADPAARRVRFAWPAA